MPMMDRVIGPLKAAAEWAWFETSIRLWRGPLRSTRANCPRHARGAQPCEAGPPSRDNSEAPWMEARGIKQLRLARRRPDRRIHARLAPYRVTR